MEKTKHRVNAKAFVEHYRSGMSAQDLMKTHRLTESGLAGLTKVLVQKGLLAPADVAGRENLPPARGEGSEPRSVPDGDNGDTDRSELSSEMEDGDGSFCPQCKARVSAKALICPECGHVLPGEERWARVEPAKSLADRVPPKVLGVVLALPLALLLFFLFRDMFIPAAEDVIDRRSGILHKKIPNLRDATAEPAGLPNEDSIKVLEDELNGLIVSDVFSSVSRVDGDYRKFVVGSAWLRSGPLEKERHLTRIRALMIRCGVDVDFEVVDFWGKQVARVTVLSVDFAAGESGTDSANTANAPEDSKALQKAPASIQEVLQEPEEQGLSGRPSAE